MTIPLAAHHAHLIRGRSDGRSAADFLEAHGIRISEGTDIAVHTYQTMGIDDVRELFQRQLRKRDEASTALFLVETSFITREAQNAMLKMFEEPASRAYFVLSTPHPDLLLPTLRSRLIDTGEHGALTEDKKRHPFASLPYDERMSFVAPLIEEGNRSDAEALLRSLTAELGDHALQGKAETTKLIRQLDRLHGYITDSSSSVKLILEYVVFTVPSS